MKTSVAPVKNIRSSYFRLQKTFGKDLAYIFINDCKLVVYLRNIIRNTYDDKRPISFLLQPRLKRLPIRYTGIYEILISHSGPIIAPFFISGQLPSIGCTVGTEKSYSTGWTASREIYLYEYNKN